MNDPYDKMSDAEFDEHVAEAVKPTARELSDPEDCPTPFYHQTHRYCPSCTWVFDPPPQVTHYVGDDCPGGHASPDMAAVVEAAVAWAKARNHTSTVSTLPDIFAGQIKRESARQVDAAELALLAAVAKLREQ